MSDIKSLFLKLKKCRQTWTLLYLVKIMYKKDKNGYFIKHFELKLLIWQLGLHIVKSFLGILKVPSESMYEAVKS